MSGATNQETKITLKLPAAHPRKPSHASSSYHISPWVVHVALCCFIVMDDIHSVGPCILYSIRFIVRDVLDNLWYSRVEASQRSFHFYRVVLFHIYRISCTIRRWFDEAYQSHSPPHLDKQVGWTLGLYTLHHPGPPLSLLLQYVRSIFSLYLCMGSEGFRKGSNILIVLRVLK